MFEYVFEEHKEFTLILAKNQNSGRDRLSMDYALTLDCAKDISILQRTEKGIIARHYFIEIKEKCQSTICN
jgi:anti-repressor protein